MLCNVPVIAGKCGQCLAGSWPRDLLSSFRDGSCSRHVAKLWPRLIAPVSRIFFGAKLSDFPLDLFTVIFWGVAIQPSHEVPLNEIVGEPHAASTFSTTYPGPHHGFGLTTWPTSNSTEVTSSMEVPANVPEVKRLVTLNIFISLLNMGTG
jgi:hypothetical protein